MHCCCHFSAILLPRCYLPGFMWLYARAHVASIPGQRPSLPQALRMRTATAHQAPGTYILNQKYRFSQKWPWCFFRGPHESSARGSFILFMYFTFIVIGFQSHHRGATSRRCPAAAASSNSTQCANNIVILEYSLCPMYVTLRWLQIELKGKAIAVPGSSINLI